MACTQALGLVPSRLLCNIVVPVRRIVLRAREFLPMIGVVVGLIHPSNDVSKSSGALLPTHSAIEGTGVGPRSASRAVIGAGINTAISDHRGRLPFVSGVERHQP